MNKFLFLFLISSFLSSCTYTYPVAVIDNKGKIMRGTSTASFEGGSFLVSDGNLKCTGTYDPYTSSITISGVVHCSDGRKGIFSATRNNRLNAGYGRVRLNDGSEADFIFGENAASF